jgi:hypothetical protein
MRMEKLPHWDHTTGEGAIKAGIGVLNVNVFGTRALAGVKNAIHA